MSEQEVIEETVGESEQGEAPAPKTRKKKDPPPPPARKVAAREAVAPHVYTAINEVKLALEQMGGITKDRQTDYGDRYFFRGIDDMYNTLCGITAEHGLVMIPRVVESRFDREERANGKGMQTHVFLTVEIDFVSAVDGTKHTGVFIGEAIDTGDKASNKAMSGAMKYACIMAFQIPTHGESGDDIERHHTETGAGAAAAQHPPQAAPRRQAGPPPEVVAAIASKAEHATSFEALYEMFTNIERALEPGRGLALNTIQARAAQLIQHAPDVRALQGAKGLIQALKSPQPLMQAYTHRYNELRGTR